MAARRALRKLGQMNAGDRRIGSFSFASRSQDEQQHESTHPGSFSRQIFPGVLHDDEDRERGRSSRMLACGSGRGTILSGMGPLLLHHRIAGSSGSVRFCSTAAGGAAIRDDIPAIRDDIPAANVSLQPDFVDAAQNVMTSDLASAAATFANEIEAATSVSYPWTAVLQQFVNAIHVHTGLPWWGSIALGTVIVRALVFPLTVYQVKLTARFSLLRPELEKIKADIANCNYDQAIVQANQKKMNELFAKHKTNPFTPLLGAMIQAPVFMCFFFGIRTMASEVESFKQGGALWFTDLSAQDPYYILPVLTGLTFLLVVELGVADGMQGQPVMKTMLQVMRVFSVLLVPLTLSFPTALFPYWLTSNLWTMGQGAVLRNPRVKEILDIPETRHLDNSKQQQQQQQPQQQQQQSSTVRFTPPRPMKKSKRLAQ